MSRQQDTSIAEEGEEEGEGEESPHSQEGVESVDGEVVSSQEQKRLKYKDMSNWTKSLDRRSPLSPPRNGQSQEDCKTEGQVNSPVVDTSLLKESGKPGRSGSQWTSLLTAGEEYERVSSSSSDSAVVTGKPPLPPAAMEGRKEKKQYPSDQGSSVSASQPAEETDVGARRYIAQMRARGHKRTSSAPVPYQPTPAASIPPRIVVHESSDKLAKRVEVLLMGPKV